MEIPISDPAPPPPPIITEQTPVEREAAGKQRTILIVAIIAIIILVALLILAVVYLLQPTSPTDKIRDIFLIFLALESLVLGVAMIVLIIQLASLINLLQNEVRPILHATSDTVNNLRGTAEFLGESVVEPMIKLNGYLAGLQRVLELMRIKPR
jgi:hypothetical protein